MPMEHENCPCMETCPLNRAMALIGGKWKMQILCSLYNNGPTRYNQLKKTLDGVSNTVLANALRELEGDGLVPVSYTHLNGDFTQKTYYLQQTLWTMDEKGIPRTGTLDLTYDNQEGHLLPKRWLPEASTAPELSPPPAAEAGTQGENDANEKTDAE